MNAHNTVSNDLPNGGQNLDGVGISILNHRLVAGGLSVWQIGLIAESNASGFGGCQCGDRALGNHAGFRFTHGRHNMECQAIGSGHIAGHELDTGIHEVGYETYRSCESVKLGYDQGGFEFTSQGQCFSESEPF